MQINGLTIYTGEHVITHGSIEIENGKIIYIGGTDAKIALNRILDTLGEFK